MSTTKRIVGINPGLYDLDCNDRLTEFENLEYRRSAEPPHLSVWVSQNPRDMSECCISCYPDSQRIYEPNDFESLYVLPDYLGGSDYSGGFVCKANYKDFLEMLSEETREALSIHTIYGGYGTYAIGIPLWVLWTEDCNQCDEQEVSSGPDGKGNPKYHWETGKCELCEASNEIREVLQALADYPLINDETLSELETEDWNRCYDDFGRNDFKKEIEKRFPEYDLDEVKEETIDELFRDLCESTNTYPEADGESMYLDMADVCLDVAVQEVRALQGIVLDPEVVDDIEETRREDNIAALQGYSHCIVIARHKYHDAYPGKERSFYVKCNPSQVIRHTKTETKHWMDVYGYRIEYTPEHNETPLLPALADSETPNQETTK